MSQSVRSRVVNRYDFRGLVIFAFLAGCSGRSTPVDGSPDGVDTGRVGTGTIQLRQVVVPTPRYSVITAFFPPQDPSTGPGLATCTDSTEGACEVTVCVYPPRSGEMENAGVGEGEGGSLPVPNGGPIDIFSDDAGVSLVPDVNGQYEWLNRVGETLFRPENEIRIRARGAEITAFEKTFRAPSLSTVTKLPVTLANRTMQRSSDFPIEWSNGSTGTVEASVQVIARRATGDINATAYRKFEASTGRGVIPSAVWRQFPTGGAKMSLETRSRIQFDQQGWRLFLSARIPLVGGSAELELE